MHSAVIGLPIFLILLFTQTSDVHCIRRPSVEEIASEYIVSRLFPSHSLLASKLLNVLIKSVEENYKDDQQQTLEEQQQFNDEVEESEDSNESIADDRGTENRNILPADEVLSVADINRNARDSIDGIIRRADRRQHQPQREQLSFGRRTRRLKPQKRGLGHCIHNCINGSGNMNFIQCKSMCH